MSILKFRSGKNRLSNPNSSIAIFVHGLFSSIGEQKDFLNELVDKYDTVAAFSYDYLELGSQAAEELAQKITELQPRGIIDIWGHSKGGLIAGACVNTFLDFDNINIRSVICINSPIGGVTSRSLYSLGGDTDFVTRCLSEIQNRVGIAELLKRIPTGLKVTGKKIFLSTEDAFEDVLNYLQSDEGYELAPGIWELMNPDDTDSVCSLVYKGVFDDRIKFINTSSIYDEWIKPRDAKYHLRIPQRNIYNLTFENHKFGEREYSHSEIISYAEQNGVLDTVFAILEGKALYDNRMIHFYEKCKTMKSKKVDQVHKAHTYRVCDECVTEGSHGKCEQCEGGLRIECPECNGSRELVCTECNCGQIECPICEGDGLYDCHHCEGDGKVECPDCNGDGWVYCGYCDGYGCDLCDEGGRTCHLCKGEGELICDLCNGKKTLICELCKGNKTVNCTLCAEEGKLKCSRCDRKGKILCDSCGGSGYRIDAQECEDCDGEGDLECEECEGDGYLECEECEGYGYLECPDCEGNLGIECEECEGEGSITCNHCDGEGCGHCNFDGEFTCKKCLGDGEVWCKTCQGDGEVWCQHCQGDGDIWCEECQGDGNIWCETCEGAGCIEEPN